MPEGGVRKPLGQGPGDWKVRLIRWAYRARPQLAVIVTFVVACLIGLAAASLGIQTLGGGSAAARAPASP